MVPVLPRMLLSRCEDSPRDFLETTIDEMVRNVAKSLFVCFDFRKALHSRDVFYTLRRCFVRLGFSLNCARGITLGIRPIWGIHSLTLKEIRGGGRRLFCSRSNFHAARIRKRLF